MIEITDIEYAELLKCKKAYDSIIQTQKKYRAKTREKYNEYHRNYYKLKKNIDSKNNDSILGTTGE